MSARPIASATISFGLVSVPVKLYSASESSGSISFNWLHKSCGTRLKQQYVCPKDEAVVEKDDMIKGYEFSKGQYVLFTPDEIKALDEKATNSIDVNEFVPLKLVDRVFVDRVYYLGPDKGGEKAYRLLGEALKETGRAGLGQYAARGKQNLVLLRPQDGVLVMEQLHYASEVRKTSEVEVPDTQVKPAELALAKQLIEQGATDEFHPEHYHDQVHDRIMEAIEKKVEGGKEITSEPSEAPASKVLDLMAALKASLSKKSDAAEAERKEARRPAKKAPETKKKRKAG
ncbi:MAG TPA: Ku protein [Gemmatimonadales bacterium]|jgi:DNA end-binding protein Ku|nr:Ku protein [Gemmatimonadales bacterium]